MTGIAVKERAYRRLSVLLLVITGLLWAGMTSWLIYDKVILEYRRRNTVDYSLLFREDRLTDFAYMHIFLVGFDRGKDRYLGHTKTIVREIEGEGAGAEA